MGERIDLAEDPLAEDCSADERAESAAAEDGKAQEGGPPVLKEERPSFREDPRAEGFFLDAELSARLRNRLATDNSNNCDPEDSRRSMTGAFKEELDRLVLDWMGCPEERGGQPEALKERLGSLGFLWPGEQGAPHRLEEPEVLVVQRDLPEGRKPEEDVADGLARINFGARHYLFLEVFRCPETEQLRIYMVNGRIW